MLVRQPTPIPTHTPTPTRTPTPNPDPYEPNDGFESAWPIPSGDPLQGYFLSEPDYWDYYYFDMPLLHSVEVWLGNIPWGSNYSLYLYNAPEPDARIGYSGNPGSADEHIVVVSQPAGRYWVAVHRGVSPTSGQPYQLCVEYAAGGPRCPRPAARMGGDVSFAVTDTPVPPAVGTPGPP